MGALRRAIRRAGGAISRRFSGTRGGKGRRGGGSGSSGG